MDLSVLDIQCCVKFQVYSKVIQLYIYIHILSHYGFYKILNVVPCAIQ